MCLIIVYLAYFLFILFLSTFFFPMPVNDAGTVRYRTVPWVTIALIVINSVVFVLWIAPDLYGGEEVSIDPASTYMAKINIYGFKEAAVRSGTGIGAFASFTSMFMHADLWHLFGNMMYLWAFGRRVEDACGAWRYLLFYLTAGVIADLGSVLLNPSSNEVPSIGASGAISGVMGAYLLLFPTARVVTLWGVGSILRVPVALVRIVMRHDVRLWQWTVSLPAWLLLIYFAVENTVPSLETIINGSDAGGINYLAHLAGFLAALLIFLFVRKDLLVRYFTGRSL